MEALSSQLPTIILNGKDRYLHAKVPSRGCASLVPAWVTGWDLGSADRGQESGSTATVQELGWFSPGSQGTALLCPHPTHLPMSFAGCLLTGGKVLAVRSKSFCWSVQFFVKWTAHMSPGGCLPCIPHFKVGPPEVCTLSPALLGVLITTLRGYLLQNSHRQFFILMSDQKSFQH